MDQMMPGVIELSDITAPLAVDKKNFKLLTGKLVRNEEGTLVKEVDKKSWSGISEAAGKTKKYDVGNAYTFCNVASYQVGLGRDVCHVLRTRLYDIGKTANLLKYQIKIYDILVKTAIDHGIPPWMVNAALIKPTSEIYEGGPLSGLNWEVMIFMEYIREVSLKGIKFPIPPGETYDQSEYPDWHKFTTALEEAGVNASYAREYLYISAAQADIKDTVNGLMKKAGIEGVFGYDPSPAEFIKLCSSLMFWATKGQLQFHSKKGLVKLGMAVAFMQCSIDKAALGTVNPIVRWLNYAIPQLLRTQDYGSRALVLEQVLGEEKAALYLDKNSFVGAKVTK